ncbi:MAG: hypothetical protein E7011_00965 [Alphaproteobacteria bacterium]|nr:hypothetical protein [Alphaproteobacteria bacterium]
MDCIKKLYFGCCYCVRILLIAVCFAMPAVAADNGCDDEDNDMIAAELALCSTHAYNIGAQTNPTGADRDLMRDVIAMKTTLITQQMYKQYEEMESLLRRLKTQLEKAVLTTGLQAKGADVGGSSSGGGTSFKSDDRNIFMAGVKNCNNELLPTDVMTCLNSNMNTISNMSGNGSEVNAELAKQLANDFSLLNLTSVSGTSCTTISKTNNKDCLKDKEIRKKKDFQECFDNMRACLRSKSYELSKPASQQNRK